jgi:pyruvate-ferredoxin/flavodoxin oxidoreductase
VLASGRNIKILVLDTEVYSNTGGQASKSTPARRGRQVRRLRQAADEEGPGHDLHDLRQNIYVAQVSHGRQPAATVKAFAEAEAYDGPALIIAYSHCIAHGIDMATGSSSRRSRSIRATSRSTASTPTLASRARTRCVLDSKAPSLSFAETAVKENRFKQLLKLNPNGEAMLQKAEAGFRANFDMLQALAELPQK